MDQSRALFEVWNWLPAFRAAAEAEHLPTASHRLRVSASALSRTIRMLEDRLGRPLFHRAARSITLNADGQRLLGAVAGAMQMLSVALVSLGAPDAEGPVYANASGVLAQALIGPALADLTARYPAIVPHVGSFESADAPALLRAGHIDVAFSSEPYTVEGLQSALLGEAEVGIYCGRSHPLYAAESLTESDLLAHSFVAFCANGFRGLANGMPLALQWHVAAVVSQAEVMMRLCVDGQLLAVLPDLLAWGVLDRGSLRRLPIGVARPESIYATHRTGQTADRRTSELIAAVRAALDRVAERRA